MHFGPHKQVVLILFAFVATGAAGYCFAQEISTSTVGLNTKQVASSLKIMTEPVTQSIVEIHDENQLLCLGTIVSKKGLIVTKASELNGKALKCRLYDGTVANAQLIGSTSQHDLALLQIEPVNLVDEKGKRVEIEPITFETHRHLGQGSFVVSVESSGDKPSIGIISVEDLSFSITTECTDCIDVGLECTPIILSQPQQQFDQGYTIAKTQLMIQRVLPRTIAEDCNFLVGDVIELVNGNPIASQHELVQFSQGLRPGDRVHFLVYRNGQRTELSTTISRHSNRIYFDRWGGGPFNRRRFGFPDVLAHDIPIHPDQCGGPIVNLHGQVVGINVARSLRVATLAIPIENVREFVISLRPDAELVVAP